MGIPLYVISCFSHVTFHIVSLYLIFVLNEDKREEWKIGLKLNIQKTKIMASGPIPSCQIDGETMETVKDFTFFGSKIAADGDCSRESNRRLFLGRKAMTNLAY